MNKTCIVESNLGLHQKCPRSVSVHRCFLAFARPSPPSIGAPLFEAVLLWIMSSVCNWHCFSVGGKLNDTIAAFKGVGSLLSETDCVIYFCRYSRKRPEWPFWLPAISASIFTSCIFASISVTKHYLYGNLTTRRSS